MKPMLASDILDLSRLRFPLGVQPKIDGVRALNLSGRLTGRSLKEHKNVYTTSFFSRPETLGFDGELAAEHQCHPDLCRLTTSAAGTIAGMPITHWHVFDLLTSDVRALPYRARYKTLTDRVHRLRIINEELWSRIIPVPVVVVRSLEELLDCERVWLEQGYEGIIIRDLDGKHKSGRSTVREMGLLRLKRFVEANAVVESAEEGRTNLNAALKNELGYIERSTHQENMLPNGMVGSLRCKSLEDIFDPQQPDKLLITKGQSIIVAPGKMSNAEAVDYFENPHKLVGKVIKYKFFPKGVKDKPRFPTFQSIRNESDL